MRKTAETLQVQVDRRNSTADKNAQRADIDESMGEGGGDEEEDGKSEDDNEDGQRSGVTSGSVLVSHLSLLFSAGQIPVVYF